ncbi:MAG: serine protease [Cyanobacteria bacterium J06628_3]
MNRNLCRFNYLSIVLGGAATVITVAISQIIIVSAKSAPQINRIAQNTTVQINNNADSPGGSGVIVSKQGNTYGVLTANHVVCDVIPNRNPLICRDDIAYTIRTSNGKEYPVNIARLQNKKNDADLAIVFFNSDGNYPVAKIGNSNQVVAGSPIYVYGYPASQGRSGSKREAEFSPGFVTSRPNKRPQGYNLRYNAVTQIGMSGGAVFDSEGRVVGIHGQGDLEGELESGSGSKVMIKSGWNAAIPINIFMKQKSKVKLKDLELIVDNSLSDSKIPQINNPSNARGYNVRASVLYEQQNYTESIEASTQALQKFL